MLRPLRRWWLQWRIDCESRDLTQACASGHAGALYTANALLLINKWRRELETL